MQRQGGRCSSISHPAEGGGELAGCASFTCSYRTHPLLSDARSVAAIALRRSPSVHHYSVDRPLMQLQCQLTPAEFVHKND
jgi:hypothetical protein